jgi:hypothetical protein
MPFSALGLQVQIKGGGQRGQLLIIQCQPSLLCPRHNPVLQQTGQHAGRDSSCVAMQSQHLTRQRPGLRLTVALEAPVSVPGLNSMTTASTASAVDSAPRVAVALAASIACNAHDLQGVQNGFSRLWQNRGTAAVTLI